MILPIYAYGHPILKKEATPIKEKTEELEKLIADMWETMYNANGVGLAAPQVGKSIRLFVIDTIQTMDSGKEKEGIKQVFINAQIVEEIGKEWDYEEGCLSIPDIRADVERLPQIKMEYLDEQFKKHKRTFKGINARVIQHEYDHIEGILFVEHLTPLKRRLLRRKLDNIKKGKISSDYKMKFQKVK